MANFEGFFEPRHCPRGRGDCQALSQIIAPEHVSFVCCGEHNGEGVAYAQDRYRFCHKTPDPHGVDILIDVDERDVAHMAAVLSWATAATIPASGEPRVPVFDVHSQGRVDP